VYRPLAILVALLTLAFVAGCGGDDEGDSAATDTGAADTTEAAGNGCEDVEQPEPRDAGGQKRPKAELDPAKRYDVTLVTSCGDLTIRLNVKASPNATASFVSLARNGFFDDTIFHRIVPGFVIQAGDPTVTGGGGPGYKTVDKPPAGTTYPKGAVAMAKADQEPAGTAGSQFYIVTGDAQLPPEFAVLGKVTRGQDVADRIGQLGDPASGQAGTPLQSIIIEDVKVDVS
jgi:peptidyl-prolyl cis-trans isomerase B (cyclophilin B)